MGRTIGLLHPGAMGTSVGAAAVGNGHRVLWCPDGRSEASTARATEASFEPVALEVMASEAEAIFSICPPAEAPAVAASVAATGFSGVYVDANAVSADSTAAIGATFSGSSASYLDGGIIGLPAWTAGTTRLYLSGDQASDVADLFAGSPLEAIAIDGGIGAASSLKMCFASWTKGSGALLLAIRAVAGHHGVDPALLDEWALSQPGLAERSDATAAAMGPKGWRFAGEMHEIADTFAAAGVPDGFFRSAAELYGRLAPCKDQLDPPVTLDQVTALIAPEP